MQCWHSAALADTHMRQQQHSLTTHKINTTPTASSSTHPAASFSSSHYPSDRHFSLPAPPLHKNCIIMGAATEGQCHTLSTHTHTHTHTHISLPQSRANQCSHSLFGMNFSSLSLLGKRIWVSSNSTAHSQRTHHSDTQHNAQLFIYTHTRMNIPSMSNGDELTVVTIVLLMCVTVIPLCR